MRYDFNLYLTSVSHLGWTSRAMRLGGLGLIRIVHKVALVLLILFNLFLNALMSSMRDNIKWLLQIRYI